MTNEEFVAICKQYQEEYCKWLHPDNLRAITPLYKKYKKFCIENLLNEDDESSVYDWLNQNINNPDIMIDSLNAKFIGHDPVDKHKIIISGEYKDSIKLKTQIKRGNEKQLIEEIKQQIKDILGYVPFCHEGGNHIEFKDNDKVLYAIEWHFDPKYEQNIIKQACKELNLTYKQLGEAIGYGEEAISKASRTSNISTAMNKALKLYLENLELKNRLKALDTLSNIIKELSK
ncbi:helix-turn-helix transcriptional regulator [Campylobacter lanienae]|uniref:helix-turn-helix transcriptional regulator n=1 Tax=Campylobacter lanienae TaxID=75658 RepID=UPI001F3A0127|nr:helix-turn-helix transcriptional regulator [Campylobacter lanienae]